MLNNGVHLHLTLNLVVFATGVLSIPGAMVSLGMFPALPRLNFGV